MRKSVIAVCLLSVLLCFGCVSSVKKQNADKDTDLVGSDKDEHGCIASAGYIWSELLQNCIRPFEKGVKMVSVVDSSATSAAFLVFNADSSKIELFLPDEEEQPILDRSVLPGGEMAWMPEDGDTPGVRRVKGFWIIEQGDRMLYEEDRCDSVRTK